LANWAIFIFFIKYRIIIFLINQNKKKMIRIVSGDQDPDVVFFSANKILCSLYNEDAWITMNPFH